MSLCKFYNNRKKKYDVQKRNRCKICATSRSYISQFGLCRVHVRFLMRKALVPGWTKKTR